MLRVVLNRLTPCIEDLLSEEQAGFRAGRSTVDQIFNIRTLTEHYGDHQRPIYNNFIDFRKAFDRVWHAALWKMMCKCGLSATIITLIEFLYQQSENAVRVGTTVRSWFHATVGVRQGCILSPSLLNIFLEELVSRSLEGFAGSISIGGRIITDLRFADDIDLVAGSQEEMQDLTGRLASTSKSYGMKISTEKSKLLVTGASKGLSASIAIDGKQLEQVGEFKYLGSTITDDQRSIKEVRSRIAAASAAVARLVTIWRDRNISIGSKFRLLNAIVLSILLYACQSWT